MTAEEMFWVVTGLMGGLALFLFGMDTMGKALEKMTGGAFDRLIGFLTINKYTAFIIGAGVTALVQSSSAITVLAVGLVNSGIIEIGKAFGLIVGANLGTTATSWLLSLNGLSASTFFLKLLKPATFSPYLAIGGVLMIMFAKSEKAKNIGYAFIGFSTMMIGMSLMGQGVAPLEEVPALREALVSFSNPFVGFGFSLVFTMLIQSSDAAIGIVQTFAISVGMTYGSVIPLISGAQVGTCITAILSGMGSSNNGKRTALLNLYYNLLKNIPLLILFYVLNGVFHFSFVSQEVSAIGIPLIHTLINVLGVCIYLPASELIVRLANRTIPMSEGEKEEEASQLRMLDPILSSNVPLALRQADEAICLLAETVSQAYEAYQTAQNPEDCLVLCSRAQSYDSQIQKYMRSMSENGLNEKEASYMGLISRSSICFGKIAGHLEWVMNNHEKKTEAYLKGVQGQSEIFFRVIDVFEKSLQEMVDMTVEGYIRKDSTLPTMVELFEEEIILMVTQTIVSLVKDSHDNGWNRASTNYLTRFMAAVGSVAELCDSIACVEMEYLRLENKELVPKDYEKMRGLVSRLFADKRKLLNLEEIDPLDEKVSE